MKAETSSTPTRGIRLPGEWVTSEAVEHFRLLTGEFDLLLERDPRPCRIEIDVTGVTSLDACGCQLLAVFLGNLKRCGILPETFGVHPEIADQIRLLGFADRFDFTASEKETA